MAAGMIEDSRNLLDSDDSDEEETVFDYQSQNDKQIGKQLILLFTWATMVSTSIETEIKKIGDI